jgi:integrase/recombinase XerD
MEHACRADDPAALASTIDSWISAQTSHNTRSAYRADLNAFGRWCVKRGTIVLTADVEALMAFQMAREAAGDSPATIRRRWSALSSFYDFAVAGNLLDANPTTGVSRPKVGVRDSGSPLLLTHEAVAAYRAVASRFDPRLDALVALVVDDGLKVGEALALDVGDVTGRPPAASIVVRGRNGTRRLVLGPDSASAVRRCVGRRRTGPLFVRVGPSRSGTPHRLTRFGADHLFRQLRADDGTEYVTATSLRRFHISTRAAPP